MNYFERGETIILSIVSTLASTGADHSPSTSMKLTITNPTGTVVVNNQSMTLDSAGHYHYDYQPQLYVAGPPIIPAATLGIYSVLYVAIDGSRTTQSRDVFGLHA